MHRLALFEDQMQLNLPVEPNKIVLENLNWAQYNPRKIIPRYGCSITSLDGHDSGIPDLDSILEINAMHNTIYTEKDFSTPTIHSEPFKEFLNTFQVGRCHYIKLDAGGYFPWHRDVDPGTFRIIYTVSKCEPSNFVWLQNDKILEFEDNRWYYINTRKKHAVFAFCPVVFAVFNVITNSANLQKLFNALHIK
jgi:hypothetical protein